MPPPEEAEFNHEEFRQSFLNLLRDTAVPRAVACHHRLAKCFDPELNISELGKIPLPLQTKDAENIISKCRRSPFGKGNETIIDDRIRRSWELDPSEFEFSTSNWESFIPDIVSTVHKDLALNCPRDNMKAELYKLLLYEPGAFFKPHQDSQKAPGMFGTLVISLPSFHQGGAVVLRHKNRATTYDSSSSPETVSFAAWFSDVFHEVQPVLSGYRLVLTYNLIRAESDQFCGTPEATLSYGLGELLQRYEEAASQNVGGVPSFIAHKLEHYYSQKELCLALLKGADHYWVGQLSQLCAAQHYEIYLATFEKEVDRDEDCGSEIFNSTESFQNVVDLRGTKRNLAFDYERGLMTWNIEEEAEGDEDDFEGGLYTGNEGCPSTYWYRDTVVIIVPPSRIADTYLNSAEGYPSAVAAIEKLRTECQTESAKKVQLDRLCQLVLLQMQHEIRKSSRVRANVLEEMVNDSRDVFACRNPIMQVAIQQCDANLFEKARINRSIDSDTALELGTSIADTSIDMWTSTVTALLTDNGTIYTRWDTLQHIVAGYRGNHSVEPDPAFDIWFEEMLGKVLEVKQTRHKADGEALAIISRSIADKVEECIVPQLEKANALVAAGFALNLGNAASTPVETRFLKMAINSFWENFGHNPSPCNNETDSLTLEELHSLLELTEQHTTDDLRPQFCVLAEALQGSSVDYIEKELFPFMKLIFDDKLTLRTRPSKNSELHKAISGFIAAVLRGYITASVGEEPTTFELGPPLPIGATKEAPKVENCTCEDCEAFQAFLYDPWRKTFKLPCMSPGRCEHLNVNQYYEKLSYYTRNDTRLFTWIAVKDKDHPSNCHKIWKNKRNKAQKQLQKHFRTKKILPLLQPFLGQWTQAFVDCTLEGLPEGDLSEGLPQYLLETTGNLGEKNAKEKRKLEDDDTENATPRKAVAREVTEVE